MSDSPFEGFDFDRLNQPRAPKGPAKYRGLKVSLGQANYLRELLDDDIETTELTDTEFEQATGLLNRLDDLLDTWHEERA